jgi:hypothetical protein
VIKYFLFVLIFIGSTFCDDRTAGFNALFSSFPESQPELSPENEAKWRKMYRQALITAQTAAKYYIPAAANTDWVNKGECILNARKKRVTCGLEYYVSFNYSPLYTFEIELRTDDNFKPIQIRYINGDKIKLDIENGIPSITNHNKLKNIAMGIVASTNPLISKDYHTVRAGCAADLTPSDEHVEANNTNIVCNMQYYRPKASAPIYSFDVLFTVDSNEDIVTLNQIHNTQYNIPISDKILNKATIIQLAMASEEIIRKRNPEMDVSRFFRQRDCAYDMLNTEFDSAVCRFEYAYRKLATAIHTFEFVYELDETLQLKNLLSINGDTTVNSGNALPSPVELSTVVAANIDPIVVSERYIEFRDCKTVDNESHCKTEYKLKFNAPVILTHEMVFKLNEQKEVTELLSVNGGMVNMSPMPTVLWNNEEKKSILHRVYWKMVEQNSGLKGKGLIGGCDRDLSSPNDLYAVCELHFYNEKAIRPFHKQKTRVQLNDMLEPIQLLQ